MDIDSATARRARGSGLPLAGGSDSGSARRPAGSCAAAWHGKHHWSSRERMLATVLVGRPRLTALNADLPPKRLCPGLRAVRLSRPYRLRTMGLSGFSGGARCPVWVPTFSEVLTRIQ